MTIKSPTTKLRGAAMETRVEDEKLNPRPLERRVGPVDGETTPGTEGFCSLLFDVSLRITPYGYYSGKKILDFAIVVFPQRGHTLFVDELS